jgi:hypothetical protein
MPTALDILGDQIMDYLDVTPEQVEGRTIRELLLECEAAGAIVWWSTPHTADLLHIPTLAASSPTPPLACGGRSGPMGRTRQ